MEGRYLQVDYEQLSVGSLLAPSATSEHESQEVKIKFFDDFQAHLDKITRKRREYIFCGNWAMAHTPRDVSNSSENQHNSGFLPHERQWLSQLYNQLGYVDAFRRVNKDSDEYSWWPKGLKGDGDGWRTDFQVVSTTIGAKVEYAAIYKTQQFSSHMPVIIDYDMELQS
jgi:exodeoxyribonuclease-3